MEFIKRMIEQLVSLIEYVVSESMKFETKSPRSMIELVIRLNDLKKVSQEFSRFQEMAVKQIGDPFTQRFDDFLDKQFRKLIQLSNV
jgi:hypothetical protein